eukprot:TRINITY_DN21514_c0_g2_i3.p1 TRINITY_DN21514_c0_g2~~TRINITY_DN21514_c0_g2_i3.p1  ORF type:complete len:776 (+),score=76.71 TRINITY_DN21514_c0_g2_i3:146-2473(+)
MSCLIALTCLLVLDAYRFPESPRTSKSPSRQRVSTAGSKTSRTSSRTSSSPTAATSPREVPYLPDDYKREALAKPAFKNSGYGAWLKFDDEFGPIADFAMRGITSEVYVKSEESFDVQMCNKFKTKYHHVADEVVKGLRTIESTVKHAVHSVEHKVEDAVQSLVDRFHQATYHITDGLEEAYANAKDNVVMRSQKMIQRAHRNVFGTNLNKSYTYLQSKYDAAINVIHSSSGTCWIPGSGTPGLVKAGRLRIADDTKKYKLRECEYDKVGGFHTCSTDSKDHKTFYIKNLCPLVVSPATSVCINSPVAPVCNEFDAEVSQNKLTVLKTRCSYLISDCAVHKFLGFAHDTSVECSWIALSHDPTCPGLGTKDITKVMISFGLDLSYLQAQVFKTLGLPAPHETRYQACTMEKCDFSCTSKGPPTTSKSEFARTLFQNCKVSCCESSVFVSWYGDVQKDGHDVNHVCKALGYIDMFHEGPPHIEGRYKQVVDGSMLFMKVVGPALKKAPDAMGWAVYCLGKSLVDWMTSHVSPKGFHRATENYPLGDAGSGFESLPGGIVVSEDELGTLENDKEVKPTLACKVVGGFVFVFLASLIESFSAMVGAMLLDSAFHTSKEQSPIDPHGIFHYLSNTVGKWVADTPIGKVIHALLAGEGVAQYFGGLIWQIQNFLGGRSLLLASSAFVIYFQSYFLEPFCKSDKVRTFEQFMKRLIRQIKQIAVNFTGWNHVTREVTLEEKLNAKYMYESMKPGMSNTEEEEEEEDGDASDTDDSSSEEED